MPGHRSCHLLLALGPSPLRAVDLAVFGVDAFVGNQVGSGDAGDHQGHDDYNPDHIRIAVVMSVLENKDFEPEPKTTPFSLEYQKRRAGGGDPAGPAGAFTVQAVI